MKPTSHVCRNLRLDDLKDFAYTLRLLFFRAIRIVIPSVPHCFPSATFFLMIAERSIVFSLFLAL